MALAGVHTRTGRWRWAAPLAASALIVACERSPALYVGAASSIRPQIAHAMSSATANQGLSRVIVIGDSSRRIAQQIADGAPYDVFVTARRDLAETLAHTGLMEAPRPVGNTTLAIAAPVDDRIDPSSLEPWLRADRVLGVADPSVPLGSYTHAWLQRTSSAGEIAAHIASYEPSAASLAEKLRVGEVDAAIVYAHQCEGLGDAFQCDVIDGAPIVFWAAVRRDTPSLAAAEAFLRHAHEAFDSPNRAPSPEDRR